MEPFTLRKETAVLLISEDATIRDAVRRELPAARYRFVEAAPDAEVDQVLRASRPDIVLLDVTGAGRQRLKVCKSLRRQEGGKELPIVILAGSEDLDLVRRGHKAGVSDVLVMPLPERLLRQRLEYILAADAERRRLSRALGRMTDAQHFARIGTWEWSLATRSLEFSEGARHILGLPSSGVDATVDTVLRNVPAEDRPRVRTWLEDASRGGVGSAIEHRVRLQDGTERIVRQRATVGESEPGRPGRISVVLSDISEWRQAEAENRYKATHDAATGLENVDRFMQRVDEAVWVAQRSSTRFAILYLGVARFGRIHESLGHRLGDGVLKGIAERMHSGLRKTDWACHATEQGRLPRLARMDGAHFAIILQPIERIEDMARVATRINRSFDDPIEWGGQELFVSTHMGIAVYPEDGLETEELLRRAQTAMNRAQTEGKTEPHFSTAEMTDEATQRLELESQLRRALERDQFEVHYQPKVDIASGRIAGMEALVRWVHPELGFVSPGDFIPLAEETGVIVPIGEWVMRTAARQAKAWQDAGLPPFPMAVNVSVEQFRHVNIKEVVASVLDETGLAPEWLEIELTESALMDDTDGNLIILQELKQLGVLMAVDDFGTGYSSLAYLRRFPIDILKIDRSFVIDVAQDPDADAIVNTVINMARSLGLKVIAEGVETDEQLAFLHGLGCDQYQGYLFSRPLPASGAVGLLEEQRGLAGSAEGGTIADGLPGRAGSE